MQNDEIFESRLGHFIKSLNFTLDQYLLHYPLSSEHSNSVTLFISGLIFEVSEVILLICGVIYP